jgi:predicted  nucleic acid-binding Zn-ribbon protein
MLQENSSLDEARLNFLNLQEIVDSGLARASREKDPKEAKSILIDVQNHFRGLKLYREDREMLYGRLQDSFAQVNKRIEDERKAFEGEVQGNYVQLKRAVQEAGEKTGKSTDLRESWDMLLDIQAKVKAAKLFREHREELFTGLQTLFTGIKTRREQERQAFDAEARRNYQRLRQMVDDGLRQAEETHEYKETREYLKKIQSEFKGIRMVHEQREELYSRLQTAFDILGKRLDEYFRTKKKNWEVKMQYRLSQYSVEIFELQEAISKDKAYLGDLEDQLDILFSAGKDQPSRIGLESRITSVKRSIARRVEEMARLEMEQMELKEKLDGTGHEPEASGAQDMTTNAD